MQKTIIAIAILFSIGFLVQSYYSGIGKQKIILNQVGIELPWYETTAICVKVLYFNGHTMIDMEE